MSSQLCALLGRLAVHYRLITMDQLEEAVRIQGDTPERKLGLVLIDRGFITEQQLRQLVEAQRRYLENLKRGRGQGQVADSPTDRQGMQPPRGQAGRGGGGAPAVGASARPDPSPPGREAAGVGTSPMAAAEQGDAGYDPEAYDPSMRDLSEVPAASHTDAPSAPQPGAGGAPESGSRRGGEGGDHPPQPRSAPPKAGSASPTPTSPAGAGRVPARPVAGSPPAEQAKHRRWLHQVMAQAARARASDLHIHAGASIKLRRFGGLTDLSSSPLTPEQSEAALHSILQADDRRRLEREGEVDLALTVPEVGRFRVNVYRQHRGLNGVFHLIPPAPPTLDELGIPRELAKLTNHHQGLVLITGPAGCGKSSTMAAFVNILNEERTDHILTIEDPIEYIHPSKRSLVNQRQVNTNTESFARALRAALREDPDVICIGELRDLETISLALSAAETGHLVLGTLHTNSAIRTINRIVGVYPPSQQPQVRTMLSESLRAVLSQRLITTTDGNGVVPAMEILHVTPAVANQIRENRAFQIHSIMQTGQTRGMRLLDTSLLDLVKRGLITRERAALESDNPSLFAA